MSGRILKFDGTQHRAVQELLPWYLARTLDPHETGLVREHLRSCAQCRADLDWQRKLSAAPPPGDPGLDAEAALARLRPRLGRRPLAALAGWRRRWREPRAGGAWMRWALGAQAALIAALLVLPPRAPAPEAAAFRGLGGGSADAAEAVVKFRPDTAERDLRRILGTHGARLVDGPTAAGAYLIAFPAGQRAAAIGGLRAEPAVLLAEPLEAGGRP
jgi:hypothetical protein